jgi:hypothetical protein
MAFEHSRLSSPGIHFYIMQLLSSEGQMTMVQLVEKVCLENDVFDPKERTRIYHKCRKSIISLQFIRKVRVEKMNPGSKGNKKIKITCLE